MSSDAESYRHIKHCLNQMAEHGGHDSEVDNKGHKHLKLVGLIYAAR